MSLKSKNYVETLKNLKKKLDNQNMSVLVGAGFSKNFDHLIYPNWWELIFDMVRETEELYFKDEFESSNKFRGKSAEGEVYEEFLKAKIELLIEKTGPLQVVSNFIQRKGFREAVDIRIEEKTPMIYRKDGKRFISYRKDGQEIEREVTQNEIGIHQKLVSLPWNNIYTTNYDNLLEESLDLAIKQDLQREIDLLKNKSVKKFEEDEKIKTSIVEIEESISILEGEINSLNISQPNSLDPQNVANYDKLTKLKTEKNRFKNKLLRSNSEAEKRLKLIAEFENVLNLTNSLVVHSSELGIKKDGNIVKIHGSIREKNKLDNYGFDNDAQSHYIISKEDFDTYPIKHEAFTHLMRISLLQESFCLLGFSGIDPNFLAWIGWVRDIIQRKTNGEKNQDDKIYLIDINAGSADAEKNLFYENHRIAFVPLGHRDCISFLQEITGKLVKEKPSPKELIDLFLTYLSENVKPNKLNLAFELLKQNEYEKIWQQLWERFDIDKVRRNIFSNSKDINSLKKHCRIPTDINDNHDKYLFLNDLDSYIAGFKDDIEQQKKLLDIAKLLLDDLLIPYTNLFQDISLFDRIFKLAFDIQHSNYNYFLLVKLKNAVWNNDRQSFDELSNLLSKINLEQNDRNELIYLNALEAAFNFRFDTLQEILDNWNAEGIWIMNKAGLIGLQNASMAVTLLKREQQTTLQEGVYQLELLSYLNMGAHKFKEGTQSSQQIRALTHEGLKSISDNIDYFLKRLHRKQQKPEPYGDQKFMTNNIVTFGGTNFVSESLAIFGILIKSGTPLCIPGVYFKKSDDLYAAFLLTYKLYPNLILFFVFQYSDEKLIRRMAQEYAFDESINDFLPAIFHNIEVSYFNDSTPILYKKNGILFLSEVINVLEPEIWQAFFGDVWNSQILNNTLFAERAFYKNQFIEKGLHYISNPELGAKIINDCLYAKLSNESASVPTIIQYLYEINANWSLKNQFVQLSALLDEDGILKIINDIPNNLDNLFILGNISFLLTNEQKVAIEKTLEGVDEFKTQSERVWRIVLSFAKGNEIIISKIKPNIINSDRLWDAGFLENEGLTSNSSAFISLYNLRNYKTRKGIDWTPNELDAIFKKLTETLNQIEAWLTKSKDSWNNFVPVIQEMVRFLDYEHEGLKNLSKYVEIKDRVDALFHEQKHYKKVTQGLLTKEKSSFITAINEVSYELHNQGNFDENKLNIEVVLGKLLFKSGPALEEALDIATDWFYSFKEIEAMKIHQATLEELLTTYNNAPPTNIDPPSIEEAMIKTAIVLKFWKSNIDLLQPTLDLLKTSRFISIKYNLRFELNLN